MVENENVVKQGKVSFCCCQQCVVYDFLVVVTCCLVMLVHCVWLENGGADDCVV